MQLTFKETPAQSNNKFEFTSYAFVLKSIHTLGKYQRLDIIIHLDLFLKVTHLALHFKNLKGGGNLFEISFSSNTHWPQ